MENWMCLKNKMESSRAQVKATTLDVCGEVDLEEMKPAPTMRGFSAVCLGQDRESCLEALGP